MNFELFLGMRGHRRSASQTSMCCSLFLLSTALEETKRCASIDKTKIKSYFLFQNSFLKRKTAFSDLTVDCIIYISRILLKLTYFEYKTIIARIIINLIIVVRYVFNFPRLKFRNLNY